MLFRLSLIAGYFDQCLGLLGSCYLPTVFLADVSFVSLPDVLETERLFSLVYLSYCSDTIGN